MAKPTENLDWATNGTAQEIVEPTTGMRTEGIKSGGSWYRENLNWMFNGLGKWINYLRDDVLDKDNNLSELVDKAASFDNIKQGATGSYAGVVEKAIQTEMIAGTIGKFPDCKEVKDLVDSRFSALGTLSTQDAGTSAAQFRTNSQNDARFIPKVLGTISINTTPIGTQLIGNLHTISPSGVGNLVFGDDVSLSGTITLMPYSSDEITTATSSLPVLTSGTWKCLGAGSFAVYSGGNASYHAMMWQRIA